MSFCCYFRTDGGPDSGAERTTVTNVDNVELVDVWRRPEHTQDWPHYLIGIGSKSVMEKLKKKPGISQDLKDKFYTCKDIPKYFTSYASSEEPPVVRRGRPTKRKRATSKEPQRKEINEDEATSSTNKTSSQNQSDAEEEDDMEPLEIPYETSLWQLVADYTTDLRRLLNLENYEQKSKKTTYTIVSDFQILTPDGKVRLQHNIRKSVNENHLRIDPNNKTSLSTHTAIRHIFELMGVLHYCTLCGKVFPVGKEHPQACHNYKPMTKRSAAIARVKVSACQDDLFGKRFVDWLTILIENIKKDGKLNDYTPETAMEEIKKNPDLIFIELYKKIDIFINVEKTTRFNPKSTMIQILEVAAKKVDSLHRLTSLKDATITSEFDACAYTGCRDTLHCAEFVQTLTSQTTSYTTITASYIPSDIKLLSCEDEPKQQANFEISLLDAEDKRKYMFFSQRTKIFAAGDEGHRHSHLAPRQALVDLAKNLLGEKDSLRIFCEVNIFGEVTSSLVPMSILSSSILRKLWLATRSLVI
uniref:Uncharacterized protein n=1 Tax=Tetranychus urticae TaxID=32264 RepID=T1K2Q8_TETUR